MNGLCGITSLLLVQNRKYYSQNGTDVEEAPQNKERKMENEKMKTPAEKNKEDVQKPKQERLLVPVTIECNVNEEKESWKRD